MAEPTVTLTPATTAQKKMVIRCIQMLVAQQNFMHDFYQWKQLDADTPGQMAALIRMVGKLVQDIDTLYPAGPETLVDDLCCLATLARIPVEMKREAFSEVIH